MAIPLVLLLGLGGAGLVAAAAASSSPASSSPPSGPSSSPDAPGGALGGLLVSRAVVPSQSVAALMDGAGYPWRDDGTERYRDPRLLPPCNGAIPEALAYLYDGATPATVRARVALLRSRVKAKTAPGSIVQAMEASSEMALYNAGLDLVGKLSDKAQWPKLAESLGIPITKMVDAEQALEAAINKAFNAGRLDVTSLFNDIRSAIGGAIGDAIAAQVSQIVKGISGASAVKDAASFIGDVSQAVSVIMPFIKIIVDKAIEIDAEKRKEWAEENRSFVDSSIMGPLRKCVELGFPPPWHVLDAWNVAGASPGFLSATRWTPTDDQTGAERQARDALEQAKGLGISTPATAVRRWWAAASILAADPLVGAALAAFGRARGNFASDEQVAIVGLVVALSNNLDPWPFVELLYGYAHGWAGLETRLRRITGCGPVLTDAATGKTRRELVTDNAWILNFADLAQCAYLLAGALPKGQPLAGAPAPRAVTGATPVVGFDIRPILPR